MDYSNSLSWCMLCEFWRLDTVKILSSRVGWFRQSPSVNNSIYTFDTISGGENLCLLHYHYFKGAFKDEYLLIYLRFTQKSMDLTYIDKYSNSLPLQKSFQKIKKYLSRGLNLRPLKKIKIKVKV